MTEKRNASLFGFAPLEQLTGLDASFCYTETATTPMHIGSISIYDPSTAPGGKVRYKDILDFIMAREHLTKTFRRKLKTVPMNFDHPYWVEDKEFDIEYHVRHVALPQPGDWRQLCIQAARIHARPLDMTKPLWEFWVIEGLDNIPNIPKGSYAIISKIHHSAIDGVSGVEIMQAVHTLEAEYTNEHDPIAKRRDRTPGNLELLARAQFNALTKPFHGLNVARNLVPGAFKYISGVRRGEFHLFGNKVPRTRFNGKVSGHRVVGGQKFELDNIKSIRKKVPGATVNDVILTIVGGAMRKYLNSKDELPLDSLVCMAPVSVRSEDEKSAMGNQVSAMSFAMGTHISDPLERLHFVHEATQGSKAVANAIGARQLSEASKLAPSMVTGVAARLYSRLGLANRVRPMFNTVVSNVPGPPVPLYMNGAQLVATYGLGPLFDGLGLFHPVTSYCGDIAVSFTACRKVLPDPDFYADCLWQAYEDLYASTHKKSAPKKRKQIHAKKEEITIEAGVAPSVAAKAEAEAKPSSSEKTGRAAKVVEIIETARDSVKKEVEAGMAKGMERAVAASSKITEMSETLNDDLQLIKGVGPALEKRLMEQGLKSYTQIAELSEIAIAKLDETLNLRGRIGRDNWVAQARELMSAARGNSQTMH